VLGNIVLGLSAANITTKNKQIRKSVNYLRIFKKVTKGTVLFGTKR